MRHVRLADLCAKLNRARMSKDGTYFQLLNRFKSVQLLIVSIFLATPNETVNSVDLFEILEESEDWHVTMIASGLESNEWYLTKEGKLIADSILELVT